MRLVFMGTPEFAVPTLDALVGAGHDVALVVAQPDRPVGRGQHLASPPVAVRAREHALRLIQPTKVRDNAFLDEIVGARADAAIVIAYGRILTAAVLSAPRLGCVNLHASLLPRHRGAAPIQASILAGDRETGVCAQQMAEGLDVGPVFCEERTPIGEHETAGQLHDRLAPMAARVALEALRCLEVGSSPSAQDEALATWAPKLDKADGEIQWTDSAFANDRRVRAMTPWPSGYVARRDGTRIKLCEVAPVTGEGAPGTVLSIDPLVVACADGALALHAVQAPGRKPMAGAAWANGARIRVGEVF